MEIMKEIPNESIDMIVTDPPYKTTPRGNARNSGGMMQKDINKKGFVFQHNNIKPIEYIPEFYRVLKDGSHCYIMTNHVNLQEILNVATDSGLKFIKSLIWNKGNKIMGQYYMSQFEYILFFRKGKGKKINFCGTSDLINIHNKKHKGADGKNLHDTEKPVELFEVMIKNSSNEDGLVMDPFMGIGGAGVAALRTNRKFIGIELDGKYFNTAKKRIEDIGATYE